MEFPFPAERNVFGHPAKMDQRFIFIIRAELDKTAVPDVRDSVQKVGCVAVQGHGA